MAVRDIAASRAFYEKLGFVVTGGAQEQKWLILRNGDHVLDLFEGMFDKNLLSFNPGWDQQAQPADLFIDVRALQAQMKKAGLTFDSEVDPTREGPGCARSVHTVAQFYE